MIKYYKKTLLVGLQDNTLKIVKKFNRKKIDNFMVAFEKKLTETRYLLSNLFLFATLENNTKNGDFFTVDEIYRKSGKNKTIIYYDNFIKKR